MRHPVIILLICLLIFPGCRPGHQSERQTLTISGAWALYPMMVKWAEEYRKIRPDVIIDISAGGAGKGLADALAGMADLGMVSREIDPTELAAGAWPIAVTRDAVVAVINSEHPLRPQITRRGLTRAELSAIWLTQEIKTWNELIGTQEKLSIQPYTRSDACGAAETWAAYLGGHQADLAGIGIYGDPGLAEAVRVDRLGIGFNNINFVYDAQTRKPIAGLAIVPLDLNSNGQIDPGAEEFYASLDDLAQAIALNRYPIPPARDLYLVTAGPPRNPLLIDFLRWILTEGQNFIAQAGYIRLSSKKVATELARITNTTTASPDAP